MIQGLLDLRIVSVVSNHWGPIYHLQDECGFSVSKIDFKTISDAIDHAAKLGFRARVSDQTANQWSTWTLEEIAEYHSKCYLYHEQ